MFYLICKTLTFLCRTLILFACSRNTVSLGFAVLGKFGSTVLNGAVRNMLIRSMKNRVFVDKSYLLIPFPSFVFRLKFTGSVPSLLSRGFFYQCSSCFSCLFSL